MKGWLLYSLVVGAVWTFFVLWPMFDANERMPTADGPMMVWNQMHNAESLLSLSNPYWADEWLYPDGANLAKHTLAPGFALVAVVVKWLSLGSPYWPFYAYRVIVFASFTLMWALTAVLLVRLSPREGVAKLYHVPAFLVATCVVFSDFFVLSSEHPHFSAMWFFPLLTLLLIRFLERPILPRAAWVAVTLGASVYFTEMVIFWCMAVALLAIICYRYTLRVFLELRLMEWAICAALAVLVAAPFLVAFLRMDEVRLSTFDGALCSTPLSMIVPNHYLTPFLPDVVSWLYGQQVENNHAGAFMGYTVPLLALASLLACRRCHCIQVTWALLAVAVVLLVLSLGADMRIGELVIYDVLPFAWIDDLPVLSTFRAPCRLVPVAMFVLAIPAVWAMSHSKWLYRAWPLFALLVGLEVTYNDHVMERDALWSEYCLRNTFAMPSEEYVEEIQACADAGGAGAWVTMPPLSFYDREGVMAQVFHHQPLYGGLWSSRWEPGSEALFNEYYQAYVEAVRCKMPMSIAQWLRQRGVSHVLLLRNDWSEVDLALLRSTISVADVRDKHS